MRLLVCTTEYFPHGAGIANVVYNIVEQLKGMGVECTVCSPTGPDIELGDRALIQKTGLGGLLDYWHQASRQFKENDYDAVWLQNPFIVAGNPFRRCLVTMHSTYHGSSTHGVGNLPFHLYKSFVAHVERYCLTRMPPDALFSGVGQPVCDELATIGIPRDRITFIPNGVDTRRFCLRSDRRAIREKFGIPRDGAVLLSVGRLTYQKQPLALIETFSHLEERPGDLTLCIAGRGELLEKAKNLAREKGLRRVLFLGYVDDRDLPDLYACADYYIMASKYEGGMPPLTLAEAMAAGLPCIVSDIPHLGIVRDAGCGIAVDFDDSEAASADILDYLGSDHPDHGVNARNCATRSLDWSIIAGEYLQIFEGISDR